MKKRYIIYHSQSAHTESMAQAVLPVGELSEHSLELCEELGLSIAAGTAMGIF